MDHHVQGPQNKMTPHTQPIKIEPSGDVDELGRARQRASNDDLLSWRTAAIDALRSRGGVAKIKDIAQDTGVTVVSAVMRARSFRRYFVEHMERGVVSAIELHPHLAAHMEVTK